MKYLPDGGQKPQDMRIRALDSGPSRLSIFKMAED